MRDFLGRHKVLTAIGLVLLLAFGWVRYRMWGPYRSYRVDLAVRSAESDAERFAPLQVGVSQRDITPDLQQYDPWKDADGNGEFERKKGDTFEDRNRNGRFDFVWLAGFDANRPAKGVNDPLWARAIAFRHGKVTVVMVTIDSIGLTHERFIRIRRSIDHEKLGITHILFASTHTHQAPDTMGIWSHHPLFSRFDESYLELVLGRICEAVVEAVGRLHAVETEYAMVDLDPKGYVHDSRKPEVYDRKLCAVRFLRPGTEQTVATLLSWGNHPEALGGNNSVVSSDFAHYWRLGVEQGVNEPAGAPGLGGMCLFFQGPLGGLMTPLHLEVPDRNGQDVHREDGLGKTRALGENLALRTLAILRGPEVRRMKTNEIAVVARTVFSPIEGTFRIPMMLGLIHPGWYGGKARTEIDAVRVGEIEVLTVPGEIYPEIVDGGIEVPEGGDFGGPAVEVPPLRSQMEGGVNMVFNLANDEVGYILPRSQWDTKPPFTYGRKSAPYGEVNSGGPQVSEVVHREGLAALRRLHQLLAEPLGDGR